MPYHPPIMGHENIPWKHKQREGENTGYSLYLREVEAKYALFRSRVWLLLTKLW